MKEYGTSPNIGDQSGNGKASAIRNRSKNILAARSLDVESPSSSYNPGENKFISKNNKFSLIIGSRQYGGYIMNCKDFAHPTIAKVKSNAALNRYSWTGMYVYS
jgi:hypothetical protein